MYLTKAGKLFHAREHMYTTSQKRNLIFVHYNTWLSARRNKLSNVNEDRSVPLFINVTVMSGKIIQHHDNYTSRVPTINNTNVALSGIKLPLATRLFK